MTALTFRQTLAFFLAGAIAVLVAAILVFNGFLPPFQKAPFDDSAYGPPQLRLQPARFADIKGWRVDNPAPAFEAFLASCVRIEGMDAETPINRQENLGAGFDGVTLGGLAADWQPICVSARRTQEAMPETVEARGEQARFFFESEFAPIQIFNRRDPLPDGPASAAPPRVESAGVFTGYYEPAYRAGPAPTSDLSAPVYGRPDDLIDVDLGAFREDLAGERVAGRIQGNRLVPYPDHEEINQGALSETSTPIAWMSPNDLFFLQIQGSGQLIFDDEERLRIGYAGQNGRPYTAIGRIMVRDGILPLAEVSMQSIRQWLEMADAEDAQSMREQNESYVFFRTIEDVPTDKGPLGAQGVALTTERSLAVDRRFHALGAPVWIDLDPVSGNGPDRIRRLMIAQDTGGAIRGPVRGDVFWGAGTKAEIVAGMMNARGHMIVLVPRAVADRIPASAWQ